ncbi:MAG: DUF429 domain-containing protein [Caldilineaceae bacterium]
MSATDSIFIGIDLAWGPRNPSGGAVIRDGRLIAIRGDLTSLASIVDFVGEHLDAETGAVVAVDAPLRVPNATGIRPCERALNSDWARYQAGAHPANRNLLARSGSVRGERLVALLEQNLRFSEATSIPKRSPDRLICEIYPHPAHVSLFGLDKTLKYKRGPVQTARGAAPIPAAPAVLARGQAIDQEDQGSPSAHRCPVIARTGAQGVRGSVGCAVLCVHWLLPVVAWSTTARTYGTLADGHIIVPLTPEMAKRMRG